MRIFILIAVLSSMVFSASKATKPYTFTPHTTSSADQVNKNFDSLYVPFNKAIDTLNKVIPRWSSMLYQKDSTWRYMHIDTIVGCDTIYAKKAKFQIAHIDTITDLDSIYSDIIKTASLTIDSHDPSVYIICRDGSHKTRIKYRNGLSNFAIRDDSLGRDRITIDSVKMWFKGDFIDTGMVACSNVLTNYIQFGTTANSKCSTYNDTTFPDSIYDGETFRAAGTGRIICIGNAVTFLQIDDIVGTVTSATPSWLRGVPAKFYSASFTSPGLIRNNDIYSIGFLYYSGAGDLGIKSPTRGNLTPGNCGLDVSASFHWIK